MEPLSGEASLIEVIQTTEAISKILRRYINIGRIREGRYDVTRLQDEISALSQPLEPLQKLLHDRIPTQTGPSQGLLDDITKCAATLSRLQDEIEPKATQSLLSRWEFQPWKWPLEEKEAENVIREIKRYNSLFWLSLMLNQTQSLNLLINQKIDIRWLHIAKGAAFNDPDNQQIECLPGTQVELLGKIGHWVKTPNEKCLFWLSGLAGTGKSTIFQALWRDRGVLGASFFFRSGEQERGNAKLLFPTLARQLGDTIPQLTPNIQHAIRNDPEISARGLEEQFQKLILEPLNELNLARSRSTILIVIDALDECSQDDDVRDILELLPRLQESCSVQFRFLLTSRPDLPMKLGLQGATDNHQHLIIHEIPHSVMEHEIRVYLNHKFLWLQQERDLPADWPGEKTINTLVERTAPSFISTTTLVRFVSDDSGNAAERLEAILSDQTNYATNMEGTYTLILNQLLTNEDEEKPRQLIHEFQNTIGILILLATPRSVDSFAKLLQMETDKVQEQIKLFYPVLDVPARSDEPVQILHLSFRDFLLDKKQEEYPFWVDESLVHKKLAAQCLKVMQDPKYGLRKNICNLQNEITPRVNIDKDTLSHCLPSELQYACRYWVHHLVQSHNPVDELAEVLPFLQSHFLYWVEAMSLLGFLSEVVGMIQRLRSLTIETYNDQTLSNFVSEARSFIIRNRQIADTVPLQLYSIGLIFAREDSMIRKTFESERSTWSLVPTVRERWNGHISLFRLVAFSPDGQLLAFSSEDHTVKLWDHRTGELRQTLKGHTDWVSSIDFSLDSQLLASASFDDSIKVWDTQTGELCYTFWGGVDEIYSVTFVSDDQLSGSSENNTVKIWDLYTGEMRVVCS
ncbi:WD40-repeat-containing domain protein [Penicillium atrosanguineum]|nr:WD40-repeat-containing domain protein [Penicillium atrosanguineum]